MKNVIICLILTLISGLRSIEINAQVTIPTNTWAPGTNYLGWNTTLHDLDFRIGTTIHMRLDGTTNVGYFGIGTTSPQTILDIAPTVANMGYGINGATVLHNYGTQNIFVGEGAGASNTGSQNAALGFEAGKNNNDAGNVFIGYQAGLNSVSALNTLIGWRAGFSQNHALGGENTFVGGFSGALTQDGGGNACFGTTAGYNNVHGGFNAYIGYISGYLATGSYNSCLGTYSANNLVSGSNNCFIGYNSGVPTSTTVNNAAAIGANTVVANDNQMILGDDNVVNVGIGYSGENALPPARFSVRERGTYDYSLGQLTDLDVTAENATADSIYISGTVAGLAKGIDIRMPISLNAVQAVGCQIINRASCDDATGVLAVAGGNGVTINYDATGLAGQAFGADGTNTGAIGWGGGGTYAYGVQARCWPSATDENYGLRAWIQTSSASNINYGLYVSGLNSGDYTTASSSCAAYIDGDAVCTGTAFGFSDSRLKDNIKPINNALDILSRLRPSSYTFKTADYSHINLPHGEQYG